jgi:hypothetical protein
LVFEFLATLFRQLIAATILLLAHVNPLNKETVYEYDYDQGRNADLLQRLG